MVFFFIQLCGKIIKHKSEHNDSAKLDKVGFMMTKKNNPSLFLVFLLIYALIIPSFCIAIPDFFRFGTLNSAFTEYIYLRLRFYLFVYPLFLLLFFFLFLLTKRIWVPTLLLPIVSVAFGIATYNKTFYRGMPLLPTDFALARDAFIAVKEGFSIIIPKGLITIIGTTLFLMMISFLPKMNTKAFSLNTRKILAILVLLSLLLSYIYFSAVLKSDIFLKNIQTSSERFGDVYYRHGFFPSFFALVTLLSPTAPEDYSQDNLQSIGADITSYAVKVDPVDIIVFQVESWQNVDNFDIQLNEDIFANYHLLAEEGISGLMVSPKFGGGTANIEYEVLTGFTSSDGLTAEIPFNTGLYEGFPSIVNYASSIGYRTIAVHAYTNELYNRTNAYRMLGFQQSYYSDSFIDPEYCGPWISDRECARKIIELYKDALPDGKPIFIHGLTMQNHIPIGDDRFSSAELIRLSSSTLSDPDQYVLRCFCTCLKWTDDSLKILTDYFRTIDRKVILVAYGDHQTSIYADESAGDVLQHTDFYKTYNEETDFIKLHGTPYLIWANFKSDNEGTSFGYCAPNALLLNALNAYDVARPAYWNYWGNTVSSYTSTTSNYLITDGNKILFSKNDMQKEEYHIRELIQYDIIHGKHYLLDSLY